MTRFLDNVRQGIMASRRRVLATYRYRRGRVGCAVAGHFWKWGLAFLLAGFSHPASAAPNCQSAWYAARLTTYESYPAPGSEECVAYNGCTWAGQFYGIEGKKSEDWVARHNIVAVHEKDWQRLGMRVLRLKMGDKEIYARAIDLCADADCDGCCTDNLSGEGYLIDMEIHTAQRFGRSDGIVEFQVCQ